MEHIGVKTHLLIFYQVPGTSKWVGFRGFYLSSHNIPCFFGWSSTQNNKVWPGSKTFSPLLFLMSTALVDTYIYIYVCMYVNVYTCIYPIGRPNAFFWVVLGGFFWVKKNVGNMDLSCLIAS